MLTDTTRSRSYQPGNDWTDVKGTTEQLPGSRRRLSQGELHLIDDITDALWHKGNEDALPMAEAVRVLIKAAPTPSLARSLMEPPSEAEILAAGKALADPQAKLTALHEVACAEGAMMGFLAGQRAGFRLGAVMMQRLHGASATNPMPLTELKDLPPAEALTLLVSAMGDDAALDRLIGYLVTGAAPEFIPGPVSEEGGEE